MPQGMRGGERGATQQRDSGTNTVRKGNGGGEAGEWWQE